jgi:hypothetical protein
MSLSGPRFPARGGKTPEPRYSFLFVIPVQTSKVNGIAEDLTWEAFRETLIEQAEQGVDCKFASGRYFP